MIYTKKQRTQMDKGKQHDGTTNKNPVEGVNASVVRKGGVRHITHNLTNPRSISRRLSTRNLGYLFIAMRKGPFGRRVEERNAWRI